MTRTVESVVVRLSPSVTLIHGDCLECGPFKADAVITDPPYGMAHPCNYGSRGRGNGEKMRNGKPIWSGGKSNDWADVIGDDKPFDPSWILALGVPSVLWGANWYADKLPPSSGWLVWDKERPGRSGPSNLRACVVELRQGRSPVSAPLERVSEGQRTGSKPAPHAEAGRAVHVDAGPAVASGRPHGA